MFTPCVPLHMPWGVGKNTRPACPGILAKVWILSKGLSLPLRHQHLRVTGSVLRENAEIECLQENWRGGHTNSKGDIHVGDKRGDEQRDKTIYVDSVPQENLLRQWEYLCLYCPAVTAHLLLLRHHSCHRTACVEGSLSKALKWTGWKLPIIWKFPARLEESESPSRVPSEVLNAFCQPIKNVWKATTWNPNPTLGSPWLLAEPQQISGEKQGQLPPCCDLPEELSSTGNPTTEHRPKRRDSRLNQGETFCSAPGRFEDKASEGGTWAPWAPVSLAALILFHLYYNPKG